MEKDLTVEQAAAWVQQELAKLNTSYKMAYRMDRISGAFKGFWNNPSGINYAMKYPNTKQAQVDLYNAIAKKLS